MQFHQLFSNLVGNSLKFSDDTPVIEIAYALERGSEIGRPDLQQDKRYHVFMFKDNGIGFDQQYEDQIFGLFNRLHNRRDYSGTRIGLALCKKIVVNHNGVIKASSVKGQHLKFFFQLRNSRQIRTMAITVILIDDDQEDLDINETAHSGGRLVFAMP